MREPGALSGLSRLGRLGGLGSWAPLTELAEGYFCSAGEVCGAVPMLVLGQVVPWELREL